MIRVGGGECSTSESLREQVGGRLAIAIEKDAVHKDGKLLYDSQAGLMVGKNHGLRLT